MVEPQQIFNTDFTLFSNLWDLASIQKNSATSAEMWSGCAIDSQNDVLKFILFQLKCNWKVTNEGFCLYESLNP